MSVEWLTEGNCNRCGSDVEKADHLAKCEHDLVLCFHCYFFVPCSECVERESSEKEANA